MLLVEVGRGRGREMEMRGWGVVGDESGEMGLMGSYSL